MFLFLFLSSLVFIRFSSFSSKSQLPTETDLGNEKAEQKIKDLLLHVTLLDDDSLAVFSSFLHCFYQSTKHQSCPDFCCCVHNPSSISVKKIDALARERCQCQNRKPRAPSSSSNQRLFPLGLHIPCATTIILQKLFELI